MKVLTWFVRIALFLLVLIFSVRNTDSVIVNWAPGVQTQSPLVIALLGAFLAGALFAWLILIPSWLKAKRNVSVANKALARAEKAAPSDSAKTSGTPDENLLALPAGSNHGI